MQDEFKMFVRYHCAVNNYDSCQEYLAASYEISILPIPDGAWIAFVFPFFSDVSFCVVKCSYGKNENIKR